MPDFMNQMVQYKDHIYLVVFLIITINGFFIWLAKKDKLEKKQKTRYFSFIGNAILLIWLFCISYLLYGSLKDLIQNTDYNSKLVSKNFRLVLENDIIDDKSKQKKLLNSLVDIDTQNFHDSVNQMILLQVYVEFILTAFIFCLIRIWMNKKQIKELESKFNKKIEELESKIHPNAR